MAFEVGYTLQFQVPRGGGRVTSSLVCPLWPLNSKYEVRANTNGQESEATQLIPNRNLRGSALHNQLRAEPVSTVCF